MLRRVIEDAVLLQKGILFLAEQQPPLMEKGDVVAELFQIAENVGGDQDGVGLVPVNSLKSSKISSRTMGSSPAVASSNTRSCA